MCAENELRIGWQVFRPSHQPRQANAARQARRYPSVSVAGEPDLAMLRLRHQPQHSANGRNPAGARVKVEARPGQAAHDIQPPAGVVRRVEIATDMEADEFYRASGEKSTETVDELGLAAEVEVRSVAAADVR